MSLAVAPDHAGAVPVAGGSGTTAQVGVQASSWPQSGTLARPFGAAFNDPIPPRPVLDRRSAAIARYLAGGGAAYANLYDYGTPIYRADSRTPRVRVTCTRDWGPCDLERLPVPMPSDARANRGSDAALVVVDHSTGRVYEYWQARRTGYRTWRTSWGEVTTVSGNAGGGSTGSGISRLAGVIRAREIANGAIPHALVIATDNACAGTFRIPATKTDGWSRRGDCVPQGARVQLDPAVDLSALPLSRAERAVAVALQRYGAYVIDNAAVRMAVMFERPHAGAGPYPRAGLRWDYYAMRDVPWERLRVLRSWHGS